MLSATVYEGSHRRSVAAIIVSQALQRSKRRPVGPHGGPTLFLSTMLVNLSNPAQTAASGAHSAAFSAGSAGRITPYLCSGPRRRAAGAPREIAHGLIDTVSRLPAAPHVEPQPIRSATATSTANVGAEHRGPQPAPTTHSTTRECRAESAAAPHRAHAWRSVESAVVETMPPRPLRFPPRRPAARAARVRTGQWRCRRLPPWPSRRRRRPR